jgi:hypothetical protein
MFFARTVPRAAALSASLVLASHAGAGHAAVRYALSIQPVDQSLASAATPSDTAPAPVLTEYVFDRGTVRIGGERAGTVFLFKADTMTAIDTATKTCHVLRRATTAAFLAHYADEVRLLEAAAAQAPAGERDEAQRKAQGLRESIERREGQSPRDFKETARFDAVDGRKCRIWEEREDGVKRLEICVAPEATIPGGGEILAAMKVLSQFHEGGQFALGVDFGLSDWWPDIAGLGGVPLLIHEFKFDSIVTEIVLKGIGGDAAPAGLSLALPADCRIVDGPDYAQWYVR